MTDIPFATFAFPAYGQTTNRTLPTRLSDVVNVLDYGADPTGVADSTTAIQNAINAAFGAAGAPHGKTNANLNKAVFIPNGYFIISGSIHLTQVYGGHIFGAGRNATYLWTGDNTSAFIIDGMTNTTIEGLAIYLQNTGGAFGGTGIGIDLDWGGSDVSGAGTVGLQGNVLKDLHIANGKAGIRIGASNHGGSNNLMIACFTQTVVGTANNGLGGICAAGSQAIGNVVIGGNSQFNSFGIRAIAGGFSLIQGVSLQNFGVSADALDGVDVQLDATSVGPTAINGLRTEGPTFVKALSLTQPVMVGGCNSVGSSVLGTGTGPLVFCEAHGPCTVEACISTEGNILAREAARLTVRQCWFLLQVGTVADLRTNWLDADPASLWRTAAGNPFTANIEIESVNYREASNILIVFKQRRFPANSTTITTQTYTVV